MSDKLNFPKHNGIREASLLMVKEKCGRYTLTREPLYLDRCVVCSEADWDDYFEVQEISSKDTFIFKVSRRQLHLHLPLYLPLHLHHLSLATMPPVHCFGPPRPFLAFARIWFCLLSVDLAFKWNRLPFDCTPANVWASLVLPQPFGGIPSSLFVRSFRCSGELAVDVPSQMILPS